MTKQWTIIEKTIGGLEFIWGVVILFITIWGMKTLWDVGVNNVDNLSLYDISLLKVVKKYHFQILLACATAYSGVLLLMNKRTGWLTSIVTSFLNGIGIIISLLLRKGDIQIKVEYILYVVFISLIFLIIFLLLLNESFRDKYKVTGFTWKIISIALVILMLDKLLIN